MSPPFSRIRGSPLAPHAPERNRTVVRDKRRFRHLSLARPIRMLRAGPRAGFHSTHGTSELRLVKCEIAKLRWIGPGRNCSAPEILRPARRDVTSSPHASGFARRPPSTSRHRAYAYSEFRTITATRQCLICANHDQAALEQRSLSFSLVRFPRPRTDRANLPVRVTGRAARADCVGAPSLTASPHAARHEEPHHASSARLWIVVKSELLQPAYPPTVQSASSGVLTP